MVGAGAIAEHWLAAVREERLDLVAVVDLDLAKARNLAREQGFDCRITDDLESALGERPDLVLDLTYPSARDAVSGRALARGIPVLCEKPMAETPDQAERLARAARDRGVLFAVSQSRRWEPGPQTVHRAVAAGLIGEVTQIHCDFFLAAHFEDFEPRKGDDPEESYAVKTTMKRREMDEPLLADLSIHHFDMARFMVGKDPVSVTAHAFHPRGSFYRGNCSAVCLFQMADDVVFSYRGSWSAEGCTTGWNGSWRVVGQRGTLTYADGQPVAGQVVEGVGFRREARPLDIEQVDVPCQGMHGALREFLTCLRHGGTPSTSAEDNLKSLSMMFGAIESSRRGQPVPAMSVVSPA